MDVLITTGEVAIEAKLYDTPTGKAIADALPLTGSVNRWGGEIYFSIPVSVGLEDGSRDVLEPGELGYWPTGNAFCIFFGATPASQGDECRAASAVNVFGKMIDIPPELWKIEGGAKIVIKKLS